MPRVASDGHERAQERSVPDLFQHEERVERPCTNRGLGPLRPPHSAHRGDLCGAAPCHDAQCWYAAFAPNRGLVPESGAPLPPPLALRVECARQHVVVDAGGVCRSVVITCCVFADFILCRIVLFFTRRALCGSVVEATTVLPDRDDVDSFGCACEYKFGSYLPPGNLLKCV